MYFLVCKSLHNFFKSQTQDVISRKHLLVFCFSPWLPLHLFSAVFSVPELFIFLEIA